MKPTVKTHAANVANNTLPEIDITTGEDPAPAAPLPGGPHSPVATRLDPTEIYVGPGPNRDEASFQSDEFSALSDSIFACRGNLQPIAVIPLAPTDAPPGTRYKYQLISGERRLRACREHKLPVFAIVGQEGSLPLEVVRAAENQLREPLKPIEFGRQLQVIVRKYPELSMRAIARIMGRDSAQVERCLDIAELPAPIIECFQPANGIRTNDATPLKQAYQSAPDAVLAAAEEICKGPPLKAGEIVKRLSEAAAAAAPAPEKGRKKGDESFITPLQVDGEQVGEMRQDKAGRQLITLIDRLTEGQRQALNRQLERFVREKVRGQKKPKKSASVAQESGDAAPAKGATGSAA